MRCDELISKISEYLDGKLSTEEKKEFERHLSRCSSCAKELEQTKKTVELCHSLKELPLPEGFSQQLKERLCAQPAPQKRLMPLWLKDRRLYMGVAALAASFVLILGPFYTMYQNSNTPVEPAIPAVTQTPSEQGKVSDSEIENRGMQEETELAQAVVPSSAPTPQVTVTPQAVQPTAEPQPAASDGWEDPAEQEPAAAAPIEPEQAPQEEQLQVQEAAPVQSPQRSEAPIAEGLLQSPAPVARADAAEERSVQPSEKNAQVPEAEDALVFSAAMPTSLPEDSASGAEADNAALDCGGSGGSSSGSRPRGSSAALGGGSGGGGAVATQLSSVQVVAVKDTDAMQQLLKQQNAIKQKETEEYSVYQVEEDKLDLILTDAEETSYPEGYMDGVQEKEGFAYVILIQQ